MRCKNSLSGFLWIWSRGELHRSQLFRADLKSSVVSLVLSHPLAPFGIFLNFWIEVNLCQEGSSQSKVRGQLSPSCASLQICGVRIPQSCVIHLLHHSLQPQCSWKSSQGSACVQDLRLSCEFRRLLGPGKHLTEDGTQLTRRKISSSRE